MESVGPWRVLSVEPEGVRGLESLRKPANQVRGNQVIIAVRGVRRHATEPQTQKAQTPKSDNNNQTVLVQTYRPTKAPIGHITPCSHLTCLPRRFVPRGQIGFVSSTHLDENRFRNHQTVESQRTTAGGRETTCHAFSSDRNRQIKGQHAELCQLFERNSYVELAPGHRRLIHGSEAGRWAGS